MKQFSNKYMLLYALGLAAVVALVLTIVATSLKPRQDKNRDAETKQMILKTIGIKATRDNAAELYDKNIDSEISFIAEDGTEIPYYTFDNGIVISLKGNGLWGPIWGYMALDHNGTVLGAVFDHQGETPVSALRLPPTNLPIVLSANKCTNIQ